MCCHRWCRVVGGLGGEREEKGRSFSYEESRQSAEPRGVETVSVFGDGSWTPGAGLPAGSRGKRVNQALLLWCTMQYFIARRGLGGQLDTYFQTIPPF